MSSAGTTRSEGPALDLDLLDGLEAYRHLERRLAEEPSTTVGGLWGASQALVLAALLRDAARPWLVLTASDPESYGFADDLDAFGAAATVLPSRESYSSGGRSAHADADAIRARLQVAQRLAGPADRRPRVLVASLLSVLQPLPSPERIAGDFLHLQVGARLDAEELLERLVGVGYAREPLAEEPGEVSLRGDILDLFPFAAELPLRVELFDDEIESLRVFDPADQRSLETLPRTAVCLASDAGGVEDGQGVSAARLLGADTVFARIEPLRVADQAHGLRIQSSAHARALDELAGVESARTGLCLQSLPAEEVAFDTRSVEGLAVGLRAAPEALRGATLDGTRARVLCRTEAEEHRFRAHLDGSEPAGSGAGAIDTRLGSVSRGFRFPALGWLVVNHRELAGVELGGRRSAKQRPVHRARALQSFFELKVGDLVVHAVHGLARYAGLVRLPRNGGEEEHLHLQFADEVSLYVPAGRVDLVQRYIGSGSKAPSLDKIGSQAFRRRKERVGRALADLAAEMLEVQAQRELHQRPRWPEDDELVRDMVGSFPFDDTPDQATADGEIARDLASERPMDRLLCGDVGFGKTEVAVRAAFRVVNGGGQVAVLVPTTVLADQHTRTFRERLAGFPVEVATITRHATGKAAREVVERVREGQVDVVVGSHRILSKDVEFKRLGLVIIDEEQRFGVTHKEHFKRLRASVDVLTLTATPIPRTLHMSLAGVRDISALTVPPEGRQDIETILAYTEDREELRATLLREKNRGGQVFFLHNRVQDIEAVVAGLRELAPECTYLVGHGQMGGRELKRVMDAFTRGEADVLVATTIIENGIDIPSAGTIVIDRADRFGLSELHQLRGRVGRGRQKAYCYLLVDRSTPLSDVAKKRLKALEEMSQLGAGFAISMRDLEIRGAGNILGPEQSGHILAVGYDMYCRLLKQTVELLRERGSAELDPAEIAAGEEAGRGVELELGIAAYLPSEWIPSADTRLELLRSMDAIHDQADADELEALLRDRYGRVPPPARALVRQFRLKARLEQLRIRRLSWRDGYYAIDYDDRVLLEEALGGSGAELRPIRTGLVHLVAPAASDGAEGAAGAESALAWFEGLLQGRAGGRKMTLGGRAPSR